MGSDERNSANTSQPAFDRLGGADGATGSFTWLPEQPTETVAHVGEQADDAAFVDSVAADVDD